MPVFNASQNSFVYPTPKFCTRKERPQQRPRTKRNQTTGDFSNDDAGDIFISLWANFLNEFYWDDGNEYTSWINRRDVQFEDKEQESRFLNLLILIPIALYLILMLLTGLFAPIVGFILFRILYFLWTIVWNRYTRKFLRAIWLWVSTVTRFFVMCSVLILKTDNFSTERDQETERSPGNLLLGEEGSKAPSPTSLGPKALPRRGNP